MDFDRIYETLVGSWEGINPSELKPLLSRVVDASVSSSFQPDEWKKSISDLCGFLSTEQGALSPYFVAVGFFFCDPEELWTGPAKKLPPEFVHVLTVLATELPASSDGDSSVSVRILEQLKGLEFKLAA